MICAGALISGLSIKVFVIWQILSSSDWHYPECMRGPWEMLKPRGLAAAHTAVEDYEQLDMQKLPYQQRFLNKGKARQYH